MHRIAIALVVLAGSPAAAQAPLDAAAPHSLQGDTRAWTRHPAIHALWEQLRVACRQGCAKADPDAFEKTALDTVQGMGPSMGMSPQHMREHLKAIPRQLLQIGAEDPAILSDYDKFVVALVGPA